MIVLNEMNILKEEAEFNNMISVIERACKDETHIDLVEQNLCDQLFRLGLFAMGRFVHAQRTGDLGSILEYGEQRFIAVEKSSIELS